MKQKIIDLFRRVYGCAPTVVTRAPGRIEFIGNHTDYNGGTVLGAAIDRGVWVAVALRTDAQRVFYSEFSGKKTVLAADITTRQEGEASWINYPIGVLMAMPGFDLKVP